MFSLTACLAFLENEKDEEAFLRYYERYHRLVLYEAEKIVGPSAAEDVMQNTFVYIAQREQQESYASCRTLCPAQSVGLSSPGCKTGRPSRG